NFASEHRLARVYSPVSAFAMRHTDRKRRVQPALFERVYDHDLRVRFSGVRRTGNWWVVDVSDIAGGVIVAEERVQAVPQEKTICICHDIERQLGHVGIDADFTRIAAACSPNSLDDMLAVERQAQVHATYNVVGVLFNEVRLRIE